MMIPLAKASIDTRTIKENELFIALKGNQVDGHFFVEEALQKGAAGCVVKNDFKLEGKNIYKVDNPLETLYEIAKKIRKKSKAKIIAITGSSGKTTTKEMFALALKDFNVCYSKGTYNNHIGVPLSITQLIDNCDFGIFEIGTNNPGEIEPLSRLISPDIAVITTISKAHIGNFLSESDLKKEKLSITAGLKGNLISDFEHEKSLKTEKFFDGKNVHINGKIFPFNLTEKQYMKNALLVLSTLDALGINLEKPIKHLESFEPLKGRGKTTEVLLPTGKIITLVDDSYNANPESMKFGLETFKTIKSKRKVAILGEMLELGTDSKKYHFELLPTLDGIEKIIFCGKEMEILYGKVKKNPNSCMWIETVKDLKNSIPEIIATFNDGDSVFVKGSKGSKVSLIVDSILGNI